MIRHLKKTSSWSGLLSGAALIAIAAVPLASTVALAAGRADGYRVQIAQGQPPPPQQKRQQMKSQQFQHGGPLQYRYRDQLHHQQGSQQAYQQGGQPPYPQGRRYDWNGYQPGHPPPQWQQYHRTFDPHPYQWNQYADHSYRWQPYAPPRGWYYRHWTYGQYLPPAFWGRNYWMFNYWGFGLVNPPYGYVWVRYGNDALLINVATGQILGSVYWLFY